MASGRHRPRSADSTRLRCSTHSVPKQNPTHLLCCCLLLTQKVGPDRDDASGDQLAHECRGQGCRLHLPHARRAAMCAAQRQPRGVAAECAVAAAPSLATHTCLVAGMHGAMASVACVIKNRIKRLIQQNWQQRSGLSSSCVQGPCSTRLPLSLCASRFTERCRFATAAAYQSGEGVAVAQERANEVSMPSASPKPHRLDVTRRSPTTL
jgi:hypothetical protein